MKTITVSLSKLKAANVFSSAEEVRYYLCGVRLKTTESGYTLEATCGHKYILFTEAAKDLPELDVIIKSETIDRVKPLRGAADEVQITIDGTSVELAYYGTSVKDSLIDGTYPDCARLIPDAGRECDIAAGIGIVPAYIGDFAKVNKLLGFPKLPIKMTFGCDRDSIFIRTEHYKAVVMPMRL